MNPKNYIKQNVQPVTQLSVTKIRNGVEKFEQDLKAIANEQKRIREHPQFKAIIQKTLAKYNKPLSIKFIFYCVFREIMPTSQEWAVFSKELRLHIDLNRGGYLAVYKGRSGGVFRRPVTVAA